MKAYWLLKNDYSLPLLKIHLHKQIPFGAGLGGGSSDGAFMLQMLNKWFELNISEEKMLGYAAFLGSDCPFFILNKPVFATGRGEVMNIIDLRLNDLSLLLVKPPYEVSTANAFRFVNPKKSDISLPELMKLPVRNWKDKVLNQFEQSVFQQFPGIERLIQIMYERGAEYASMSGSGSSVFGLFKDLPADLSDIFPPDHLTYSQHL
jgi:4-diphosphocytidyl-2-C-methyl-D-erythritol kinase